MLQHILSNLEPGFEDSQSEIWSGHLEQQKHRLAVVAVCHMSGWFPQL